MYKVELAKEAAKFIRNQEKRIQRQLINKIRELARDPRPQNCKKLQGYKELYRIPSGNYRIVYVVMDKKLLVVVVRIAHRKDIYRQIER